MVKIQVLLPMKNWPTSFPGPFHRISGKNFIRKKRKIEVTFCNCLFKRHRLNFRFYCKKTVNKGWITYRFSYALRHDDANKMNPTHCHMRHSQIFDKIDRNIFVLRNLILGWGRLVRLARARLVKARLVFSIKSIDLGELLIVEGSRIHQNKSWYY